MLKGQNFLIARIEQAIYFRYFTNCNPFFDRKDNCHYPFPAPSVQRNFNEEAPMEEKGDKSKII